MSGLPRRAVRVSVQRQYQEALTPARVIPGSPMGKALRYYPMRRGRANTPEYDSRDCNSKTLAQSCGLSLMANGRPARWRRERGPINVLDISIGSWP